MKSVRGGVSETRHKRHKEVLGTPPTLPALLANDRKPMVALVIVLVSLAGHFYGNTFSHSRPLRGDLYLRAQ